MAARSGQSNLGFSCLGCGYRLRGITERRCPECGRPFDPDDPRSYRCGPNLLPWLQWTLGLATAYPFIAVAFGYAVWFYAWREIGQPPQPHIHDPNEIPGVSELAPIALLLIIGYVPALGISATCVVLANVCWERSPRFRTRYLLRILILSVATWVGWFLFMRWEPVGLYSWLLD